MKYINLHTHQAENNGALEIINILAQDFQNFKPDFLYSVGLHPWHIDQVNADKCLQTIISAATNINMLFVGECGIDHSIKLDFAIQEEFFKRQILIAETCGKPLIIHCVRAYSELIRIKKTVKSSVPWIIHGYNGNMATTLSLVKNEFYFSVGERLLYDERKHDCLKLIPNNYLFFETDESLTSIVTIYQKASAVIGINENDLISIIWNNFKTISQIK